MPNIIPPIIATIKKTPGKYMLKGRTIGFIEVDKLGDIYQLNLRFEQDGFLSDDGWTLPENFQIFRLDELPVGNLQ